MSFLINPYIGETGTPSDMLLDTALFSANTAAGNQTFNVSTFGGKVPKAAIIEVIPGTSNEADSNTPFVCRGFTDGTTSYASYAHTDLRRRQQKSGSIVLGYDGTTAFEATFVSFGTDEITINWSTAPATAWAVRVYLFGGDDLLAAVNYQSGVSSGAGNTISVGFEPDFVYALTVHANATLQNGVNASHYSAGFTHNDRAGTITSRCSAMHCNSASGWSCGVGSTAVRSQSTTGTPTYTISLSSFNSSGFTAIASTTTTHHVAFLSLQINGRATALVPWATEGEGSKSVTGLSFQPSKVFVLAGQLNSGDENGIQIGFGYFASGNINSNHLYSNFNSSAWNTGYSTTRLRFMWTDNVGNGTFVATLTSLNSDGWTFNVIDNVLVSAGVDSVEYCFAIE